MFQLSGDGVCLSTVVFFNVFVDAGAAVFRLFCCTNRSGPSETQFIMLKV